MCAYVCVFVRVNSLSQRKCLIVRAFVGKVTPPGGQAIFTLILRGIVENVKIVEDLFCNTTSEVCRTCKLCLSSH